MRMAADLDHARRELEPVSQQRAPLHHGFFFPYTCCIGAECKRHKIKCEPVDNEAKCAKCLRSGTECVPYNLNQRLLDEDAA
jgi:hypothetical protein